jgi:vacuolar protein-sorting-associated protein 4
MTDIVGLRNEVIEIAKRACEFDDKQEYEEAYKLYVKAAEKLNLLTKVDENTYNKDTYKKKAFEYIERAKALKDHQTKKEEEKKTPVPSGGDSKE